MKYSFVLLSLLGHCVVKFDNIKRHFIAIFDHCIQTYSQRASIGSGDVTDTSKSLLIMNTVMLFE